MSLFSGLLVDLFATPVCRQNRTCRFFRITLSKNGGFRENDRLRSQPVTRDGKYDEKIKFRPAPAEIRRRRRPPRRITGPGPPAKLRQEHELVVIKLCRYYEQKAVFRAMKDRDTCAKKKRVPSRPIPAKDTCFFKRIKGLRMKAGSGIGAVFITKMQQKNKIAQRKSRNPRNQKKKCLFYSCNNCEHVL